MDDKPVKKPRVRAPRIFRGETLRLTVNLVLTIVIFMALRNAFRVKQIKARMGKRYSLEQHEQKKRDTQVGALTRIGLKLLEKQHYQKALDKFTELVSLQPRYAPGHYRLAQTLALLERYDESIVQCREAIKIQPNFAEAYRLMGNNLFSLDKVPEACRYLRKAVLLNPRLEDAHLLHGSCLMQQGLHGQAVKVLQKGAKYHPDSPELFRKLAEALEQLHRDAADE